jgi:hypothetical protein
MAQGTPPVAPASDAAWRATPHCAILDGLSFAQWQHCASRYAPLLHHGASQVLDTLSSKNSETPTQDSRPNLMSNIADVLGETPAAAGTADAIHVAEVAVRLGHRRSGTWLGLAKAYFASVKCTIVLGALNRLGQVPKAQKRL